LSLWASPPGHQVIAAHGVVRGPEAVIVTPAGDVVEGAVVAWSPLPIAIDGRVQKPDPRAVGLLICLIPKAGPAPRRKTGAPHSSLARPVGAIVIIAICLRGNIRDIAQSCGAVVQRVDHALKLLVAGDGKTVGAVSAAAAASGISAGKDRIGPSPGNLRFPRAARSICGYVRAAGRGDEGIALRVERRVAVVAAAARERIRAAIAAGDEEVLPLHCEFPEDRF